MNTLSNNHLLWWIYSIGIVVGTWVFNNIITVLVSSLPAPTKDSTAKYRYWFTVVNTIIGNVKRAQNHSLESSPNWQDAVDKYIQQRVLEGTLVVQPQKQFGVTSVTYPPESK
jgi:hypothetical protein